MTEKTDAATAKLIEDGITNAAKWLHILMDATGPKRKTGDDIVGITIALRVMGRLLMGKLPPAASIFVAAIADSMTENFKDEIEKREKAAMKEEKP